MPPSKTIIWDWNGTLLDDLKICIESINSMLRARNLRELTPESYRDVFTFPVINYYKEVGFDFEAEPWEDAAMEFMSLYFSKLPGCGLTPGAREALEFFRSRGYTQAIISAMQHDALVDSVDKLGITGFFDYIGGINDHYAGSKIENAVKFFESLGIYHSDITMIGDTLHDAEVAARLQCKCILVAAGHQSFERLLKTGLKVIKSLDEIGPLFTES
ncbi:MAG TPA: HAD family hydrolase [Bacteroidales bacterium]|nr:HAD family hydrolase [Bacteroidales bacterium]